METHAIQRETVRQHSHALQRGSMVAHAIQRETAAQTARQHERSTERPHNSTKPSAEATSAHPTITQRRETVRQDTRCADTQPFIPRHTSAVQRSTSTNPTAARATAKELSLKDELVREVHHELVYELVNELVRGAKAIYRELLISVHRSVSELLISR
jgi:hypothetical protein